MKKSTIFKAVLFVTIAMLALVGCTGTKAAPEVKEENKTVTVTDVRGAVEIPENPERIVDLSGNSDILSILGYKVIGTANSYAYD